MKPVEKPQTQRCRDVTGRAESRTSLWLFLFITKAETMDNKKIIVIAAEDHGLTTTERMAIKAQSLEIAVVGNISELIEHKVKETQQLVKVLKESAVPTPYGEQKDGKSNRRERRKKQRKNKR